MSDLWVVRNPGLSAVGVADPRINPVNKKDMQVAANSYIVVGKEEIDIWRMSPGFLKMERDGKVVVENVKELPLPAPTLPAHLKPRNQYDDRVAFEIALSPLHAVQMARSR